MNQKEVTCQPQAKAITGWAFQNPSCKNCSCNPANGGAGVCNCTLGTPKIT